MPQEHFPRLTALSLAMFAAAFAAGDMLAGEDLRVLPNEIDGGPTTSMLSRHLRRQAETAFKQRTERYEAIKTTEGIAAYQARLREFFFRQLGPLPGRTPLNPQIVGKVKGDGYHIEKIIFESQPKHFVTALLYLPEPRPTVDEQHKKVPGVLVPCGHTANGKIGYQKPCILLAKNGIAAFCYDPIGQGERYQMLDEAGKPRFRSTTEHTLIGASCIPLGRNAATYRVWDGMRALDYLCSRKEIDATRIGCTGNSGGGRLTEYLMALDSRIQCAAPGCCVTTFQRRFETKGAGDAEQNIFGQIAFGMDNADYIIMRAPRPTLVCAATRDFVDIEGAWVAFREAKRIYARMGFAERIELIEADEKHGFTQPLRVAMVRWMRRWLLNVDEPITEPELETHSAEELLCTPKGQVLLLPEARSVTDLNLEFEKQLAVKRKAAWSSQSLEQTVETARDLAGVRPLSKLPTPDVTKVGTIQRHGYEIKKLILRTESDIWLPALLFVPDAPKGKRVLYIHGKGKQQDAAREGSIEEIVKQGSTVLAIDLRGIGETGGSNDNLWGGNWNDIFLSYLLGKSIVGMRTEDILIAAKFLAEWDNSDSSGSLNLLASGIAIPPAVHAAAFESQLFSSVGLQDPCPSWLDVVRDSAERGRLATTIHGALKVYDLPELVRYFELRRMTRNKKVKPTQ